MSVGRLLSIGMLLSLLLGLGYGAYQHGRSTSNNEWEARWAEQGEFQAKARVAAETSARAEEQRRQTAINRAGSNAREQNQVAAIDAIDADAAGQRLHIAAAKLAAGDSRCASYTGAAERGQTATRSAMVLSDLLKRADARAGELAKAYDAARVAGLACEVAFSSLPQPRPNAD
ncbi:DUF2514 domain-containing protein [Pseudomonas akapageensis]|uniref:DUF2514 domain-containing protein n=1 Tax=Pseudomonas akapageensis TaxID=2609961 RepID=UPI00140C6E1D|nr:DUF2514 domain-containing protein [Pseudomonas akapageensis]